MTIAVESGCNSDTHEGLMAFPDMELQYFESRKVIDYSLAELSASASVAAM